MVDYDDRGDRRFFKMQLESSLSGFSPNHLDKELISQAKLVHIAGSMAFKDAMAKANPVLLEPIMKVEVTMPEEYLGDVIGSLNAKRGQIEGMDDIGGGKIVRAFVPLAEMFGYSTELRSSTQGRGNYSMFFERYAQCPKSVQEKVIAEKSK